MVIILLTLLKKSKQICSLSSRSIILLFSKTMMKKYECRKAVRDYIQQFNPYEPAPKLGYNVAEMSRYARESNRKITELSSDEAALFGAANPL